MKKLLFILLVTFLLTNSIPLLSQMEEYDVVYDVTTPTGVSIDAYKFDEANYDDFDSYEIAYYNYVLTYGYNCRILANSTKYYNCHGYAWHNIEGRMGQSDLRWINDVDGYGDPIYNVTKYYTGNNRSYTETQTITDHLRVSYFPRDHSAVTTEDEDSVISKWAHGPLVKHTLDQCPFYEDSEIKYYKLWPRVNGSTSVLCDDQERTYTSNMSIPTSSYDWSRETNLFDYVSGSGTTSYTVRATSGVGDAWVRIQISTPSGEVATSSNYYTWVGKAQVQSISGPSSTSPYTYNYYYANANHSSGTTYDWMVSPSGPYLDPSEGEVNSALVIFYTSGSYAVLARANNVCGTTTWCQKGVYVSGGKSMSLSPNPASDYFTITIKEDQLLFATEDNVKVNSIKSDEPKNYTIRIYNNQGILVSTFTRSGNSISLPLPKMFDGLYIVEVDDGKIVLRQQLLVKH